MSSSHICLDSDRQAPDCAQSAVCQSCLLHLALEPDRTAISPSYVELGSNEWVSGSTAIRIFNLVKA